MSRLSAILYYLAGAGSAFALISVIDMRERLTVMGETSEAAVAAPVPMTRPRAVPIVDRGESFTCTPDRVWDGDGPLWCKEGPRIRLAGVAAKEMDETCRPYQPCPEASAVAARDQLVHLVGRASGVGEYGHILVTGPPLECRSVGPGKGSRTAAWCKTEAGVDINCAMVESGTALKWDRYWGKHRCG